MKQIDTVYEVETPEGVVLNLRVAGGPIRSYAYCIDFLIRWGINCVVFFVFVAVFGESLLGLLLIYFFLMEWFYPIYFEVFRKGATPGKKQMRIKVLNGDGTPIGWQSSMIRNFLLIVDVYLFGYFSCFIDRRFRRLGDLAADTVVVYEKELVKAKFTEVKAVALPVNLTVEEQKAIISFAERSANLSVARKNELAEILKPIHNLDKEKAVNRLLQYAAAISGKLNK